MNKKKNAVPFIVFEAAAARWERTVKRLAVLSIGTCALAATLVLLQFRQRRS